MENMINTISDYSKMYSEIIKEANNNNEFKQKLIDSPKQAINNLYGGRLTFKNNKKIIVEDQTDQSKIFINIPPVIDIDEVDLTEEQLEVISGGTTTPACIYVVCLAIGYGIAAVVDKAND